MNRKTGFYSAIITGVTVVIFAVSMLVNSQDLSFGICILLSWGYVALACAFVTQAKQERKAFALMGLAFAGLYAVFVNLVYFTQLTIVRQQAASPDILKLLTYVPGGWMFALDLFGYGLMALSTFFIGLTIVSGFKAGKWLKALLMVHGIFAPACFVMPTLNLFGGSQGGSMGVVALEGWCLFFAPTMVLAAVHFGRKPFEPARS